MDKAARKRIKYKLLKNFVVVLLHTASWTPRKVWLALCGSLGQVAWALFGSQRALTEEHLTLAYGSEKSAGEIRKLARQVFRGLGRNAGWVLRNARSSRERFEKESIRHGEHYADEAFKSGRGVIFLTAHLGPFECLAHEFALRGYQPFIVGTRLKDPVLNDMLTASREKFGAVSIERGKETYRTMKHLRSGGSMAILIDQDTVVKSVFVDFFGKSCATPVGATLIALKTGAAVIPVFSHLNSDGFLEINYYPEVRLERTGNEEEDLVVNTQILTTIIENEIRKHPEQWVWLHKRWKTRPVTNDEFTTDAPA